MAGSSPELRKGNEGMCSSYLEMQKEAARLVVWSWMSKVYGNVEDASPELVLRPSMMLPST